MGGDFALVEKGARLDRTDAKGNTALHAAASEANLEVVRYLLERKASRRLRNRAGETPAALARNRGHDEAAKLLD